LARLNPKEKKALARMEAIIKVRAGLMTATEAARELGISRKTWYEWENRGLQAMAEALADKDPGRPRRDPDPEKDALIEQMIQLKKDNILLQQSLDINRILNQAKQETISSMKTNPPPGPASKKKRVKRRKKRKNK
jgi:transposase